MCGIFKSSKLERFNELYDANSVRGVKCFGGLFLSDNKATIYKSEDVKAKINIEADVYLGHLRAPTGAGLEFTPDTCHPFSFRNWLVAHNGILTNHKALLKEHNLSIADYEIDSSIIPFLLYAYSDFSFFEKLQGTWSCWMYNMTTKKLYITRSANTLFIDRWSGDFSSVETDSCNTSIAEHTVFEVVGHELISAHKYNTKPLYFVP